VDLHDAISALRIISSCAFCADHATLSADAVADHHHAALAASLATSLADADVSLAAADGDADDHHAADSADLAATLAAADGDGNTELATNHADCNSSSVASPSAYRSATSTAA
jgi:hypothetical protein